MLFSFLLNVRTSLAVVGPAIMCLMTGASGATLHLHWSAPGDNGARGRAQSYDLRYSAQPITELNWAAAVRVTGMSQPSESGKWETAEISGLRVGTTYYFGIRTRDKYGNLSPLSTSAERRTCSGICSGFSGNIDGSIDGSVDISDMSMLQAFLLRPFDPVDICLEEANVDGSPDNVIDSSDLMAFISYLRGEGTLAPCQ